MLKPGGRRRGMLPGLHEGIHLAAKAGIGEHALELVSRDRLQKAPGVVRQLPLHGIELPPHFVGAMIPRRAHIQGELGERIESLDVRGQWTVCRLSDRFLFDHGFPFSASGPPKASPTIDSASSRMRRR